MDDAAQARIIKIENLLSALTENLVAFEATAERRHAEWERRHAEWERRHAEWEKRQDRLDRRVDRFARAGLAEVRRNRKDHNTIFQVLDVVGVRLSEMTDKLDAIIRIEQDR